MTPRSLLGLLPTQLRSYHSANQFFAPYHVSNHRDLRSLSTCPIFMCPRKAQSPSFYSEEKIQCHDIKHPILVCGTCNCICTSFLLRTPMVAYPRDKSSKGTLCGENRGPVTVTRRSEEGVLYYLFLSQQEFWF
mgnify:CR=1 FL=1